jgi:hypothetical protein
MGLIGMVVDGLLHPTEIGPMVRTSEVLGTLCDMIKSYRINIITALWLQGPQYLALRAFHHAEPHGSGSDPNAPMQCTSIYHFGTSPVSHGSQNAF